MKKYAFQMFQIFIYHMKAYVIYLFWYKYEISYSKTLKFWDKSQSDKIKLKKFLTADDDDDLINFNKPNKH